MTAILRRVEIRHGHLFCGLGGGARGFNRASPRHGNMVGKYRCLGGIDHDARALADFERLTGVAGTLLDLFDGEQYRAFHGSAPPKDWRPAMPHDIHRAFGFERPHIGFLSAPCKGFSGLLPEQASRSDKYQALNGLTLRGVWLFLEAYKDDPVELILFENVPRIATRGRHLLDQIVALLRAYGYSVAETVHDCGELGGLAQSRKRFLLIARHQDKVPAFVYEPPRRRLRGIGEVLERLPMPDELTQGMHRMPALQWRTWVRLAFVEAGKDWRSLNRLKIENGVLADFGIAPETNWHNGAFGVKRWEDVGNTVTTKFQPSSCGNAIADPRVEHRERSSTLGVRGFDQPSGVVAGESYPTNGAYSVADPRVDGHEKSVQFGVRHFTDAAPVITSKMLVGGGPNSIADPRIDGGPRFNHAYRVVEWNRPNSTVTAARGALAAVADPRHRNWSEDAHRSKERVAAFDAPARTVTGKSEVASGALSVADPRHGMVRDTRASFDNGGHYGVQHWTDTSGAVSAAGQHDNGRWSVADPRIESCGDTSHALPSLPAPDARLVCCIRALDGTWHRPITTLEMAALQSLLDPDEWREFALEGKSDSAWREGIGNAVPSDSAQAIGEVMGRTLLAVWNGETFLLSNEPIWVKPLAIALSVDTSTTPFWETTTT